MKDYVTEKKKAMSIFEKIRYRKWKYMYGIDSSTFLIRKDKRAPINNKSHYMYEINIFYPKMRPDHIVIPQTLLTQFL